MKRDTDFFFALDTTAERGYAVASRSWLPDSRIRTVAVDPRRWQSRAGRGFSWHARGNGQAGPGKQLTISI